MKKGVARLCLLDAVPDRKDRARMKVLFGLLSAGLLSALGGCYSITSQRLEMESEKKTVCIVRPDAARRVNPEVERFIDEKLESSGITTKIVTQEGQVPEDELRLRYAIKRGWAVFPTVSKMSITVEDSKGVIVGFANFRQTGGLFSILDVFHKWRGPIWHTECLLDRIVPAE